MRICADDYGMVLWRLRFIKPVVAILCLVARASGLTLSMKKCILVPLWNWLADKDAELLWLRTWINNHAHAWQDITINSEAVYLGMLLGPSADVHLWNSTVTKWRQRGRATGMLGTSPLTRLSLYQSRSISVLPYLSQFAVPPREIWDEEMHMMARLTKMALWHHQSQGAH